MGSVVAILFLLVACSGGREQNHMASDDGAKGVGAGQNPSAPALLDPEARAQFEQAYGRILWSMMYVRWCGNVWGRTGETAEAERRLAELQASARRLGLQGEMDQAGRDHGRQLAVVRLDVTCRDGFDANLARHQRNVAQAEALLAPRRTG